MNVIINPGTEPIYEASEFAAAENIKHLMTDIVTNHEITCLRNPDKDYGNGRYCYVLLDNENRKFFEIQMPGLPLHKVRYVDSKTQNVWDFPRLYIDDGSWIWCIAVDILMQEINAEDA